MLNLIGMLAASALVSGDSPMVSVITLEDKGSTIAVRDANGNGRLDLIQVEAAGFGYRFMLADGTYPPVFDAYLTWPSEHLAWDIVDINGDGSSEVVTISSAGEVRVWSPDQSGEFGEGRLLLKSKSYLPHGITRMRFVRDVNGDERPDLVLPAAGRFHIHLQGVDDSWEETLEIEYEADVNYRMGDPKRLDSRFGQSLLIPWFSMEDVDGDGIIDLVSRTADRIDYYLAKPKVSATPTWTLDLASLTPSARGGRDVDLDDLFSNLEQGVKWRIVDLDGVAPRDLVIQVERTIKTYFGASATGITKGPDQVLKISGNLMHFFLRDVSGSGLPDLQILRAEKVGLGQVLRWLLIPGGVEFDFFTYENTDGVFSRKPTRRNQIALELPRLISLIDDVEEIEAEVSRQREIPARRLDLDGDGANDDVLDIVDGQVLLFHNCAEPEDKRLASLTSGSVTEMIDQYMLNDLDRLKDGETRTVDLGGYSNWSFSPGGKLRETCAGKEPLFQTPALGAEGKFEVSVKDLTGNGRDDAVIWTRLESGEFLVQFLTLPAPK